MPLSDVQLIVLSEADDLVDQKKYFEAMTLIELIIKQDNSAQIISDFSDVRRALYTTAYYKIALLYHKDSNPRAKEAAAFCFYAALRMCPVLPSSVEYIKNSVLASTKYFFSVKKLKTVVAIFELAGDLYARAYSYQRALNHYDDAVNAYTEASEYCQNANLHDALQRITTKLHELQLYPQQPQPSRYIIFPTEANERAINAMVKAIENKDHQMEENCLNVTLNSLKSAKAWFDCGKKYEASRSPLKAAVAYLFSAKLSYDKYDVAVEKLQGNYEAAIRCFRTAGHSDRADLYQAELNDYLMHLKEKNNDAKLDVR
ncbi:MAG TPA: hypothetical protein VJK30_03620 [Coxiellaceae bacterium]|nr:MAG: hypothetical protein A3E81_07135 [Gammaproteobacteria bacterium RIFCSPHIGHO2_12_FULL_36_30]HLB56400.1 hypothetical protein [Coxiellaceae bacterium]